VVQYALSRRPNIKLAETGISFGTEGFTNYKGKKFHQNMRWTRRFYPHKYNVDGFFVAKLRKTGPSPSGGATNGAGVALVGTENGDEVVDRTPITEPVEGEDGDIEAFDDPVDQELIERAKRSALRRKGLNPKAVQAARDMREKKKLEEKAAAGIETIDNGTSNTTPADDAENPVEATKVEKEVVVDGKSKRERKKKVKVEKSPAGVTTTVTAKEPGKTSVTATTTEKKTTENIPKKKGDGKKKVVSTKGKARK
ncbi:MAG: 3',5'-cyclic-nucleotide phosphodiesterase (PDEase) (3':5'-CNP), partial [Chaenotheca gracillima]